MNRLYHFTASVMSDETCVSAGDSGMMYFNSVRVICILLS